MNTIKRYRTIIQNFEEEYSAVKEYADKKKKAHRWGAGETKVVYVSKTREGSPDDTETAQNTKEIVTVPASRE